MRSDVHGRLSVNAQVYAQACSAYVHVEDCKGARGQDRKKETEIRLTDRQTNDATTHRQTGKHSIGKHTGAGGTGSCS